MVSRPTPRGCLGGSGQVGGSGWVGGSPGGGLQAHTREVCLGPGPGGDIPACTKADTTPQQMATASGGTHPSGMLSCT